MSVVWIGILSIPLSKFIVPLASSKGKSFLVREHELLLCESSGQRCLHKNITPWPGLPFISVFSCVAPCSFCLWNLCWVINFCGDLDGYQESSSCKNGTGNTGEVGVNVQGSSRSLDPMILKSNFSLSLQFREVKVGETVLYLFQKFSLWEGKMPKFLTSLLPYGNCPYGDYSH